MHILVGLLITVVVAALQSVIAPPINLTIIHWFVFLPFFWLLREESPRRNAVYALLFGTVSVACIFWWIAQTIILFSNLGVALACLILVGFSVVFGLPYLLLWSAVHPLRRRLGGLWILALPAWLVVVEWAAMYMLLFPFQQGVAHYQSLVVWQLVSVTGVWGVSFLVMFTNCALAECIYRHREGRPLPVRWMCAAAATVSLVLLFGAWRYPQIEAELEQGKTLQVAQLQMGDTMKERLKMPRRKVLAEWINKTRAVPKGTDLVVWPEGASPAPVAEERYRKHFTTLAKDGGFDLLIGSGAREEKMIDGKKDRVLFNSVYHVDDKGNISERYDKMTPLPFGEYRPLPKLLAPLWSRIKGPGRFSAGEKAVSFDVSGLRVATPICYEAILSYVCRRFESPDMFINVTNDAWFGDGSASTLHGMLAAIRATEFGVPLLRSTYTGTSFYVEPHGRIVYRTELFTDVDRVITVRTGTVPTIYARFGDWFVYLCMLALAGMLLGMPWLRRKQ